MMKRILLVEDDEALRVTQTMYLKQEGLDVVPAVDRTAARTRLNRELFDVVATDLRLGKQSGLDVVRDVRELQPLAEIIVITGYSSVESAVEAMKEGAYDYLIKPVDPEVLLRIIRKALEHQELKRKVTTLRERLTRETGLDQIVAASPVMREVLDTIAAVAATDATVLIEGESGTGKELMARLIHQRSARAEGPFLVINCGAMPENLLESELFGHLRGAFTGAHKDHKGLFEAADGGTLLLDEISEVSPGFQVKLLRALQEHAIRRVGDTREMPVDVRVIAATNQDLKQLVREGRFRQDLFFRIKVIPIHIAPLRQRREDILPLAESFLKRLADRMGRRVPRLTDSARRKLLEHDWPGNVRELENTLERALIFRRGDLIHERDLWVETCIATPRHSDETGDAWMMPLEEVERRHIQEVLDRCGGNKARAAEILRIGYNTLWRKLKRYGDSPS
ncbi:MAG: sigma-54 dependent transcriptional regulator [Syntrophobacteraceae bacterium]|jgi:two-component system response regulator HydG|nr:sigma-54 dependent transcriptional regulator [Syntrophobacteraceae bacterium]MCU0587971.1 sigma-54 dependent transcriptional regulator [Syntrophobacteraceae bacterium]